MHPLDGPHARVDVARRQIDSFRINSQRFFQEHGPKWRIEKNAKTGKCDFLVYDVPDVPLTFGILVGEIAHNLAAALDGLVCQLALIDAEPTATIDDVCGRTSFPIFLRGPQAKGRDGKFVPKRFRRAFPLLKPYVTAFDRLQPYKRGSGHRANPLWRLRAINNADKHRVLTAVSVTGAGVGLKPKPGTARVVGDKIVWESSGPSQITAGLHLEEGTKIGHVDCVSPDDVNMDVILSPEMAFDETPQEVQRLTIVRTMTEIANHVGNVVESFAPEFS